MSKEDIEAQHWKNGNLVLIAMFAISVGTICFIQCWDVVLFLWNNATKTTLISLGFIFLRIGFKALRHIEPVDEQGDEDGTGTPL